MSHQTHRPVPARRLFTYRAPKPGAYDDDFGGYAGHPDDPRNPTVQCSGCEGNKRDENGNRCAICAGRGWIFYGEDE